LGTWEELPPSGIHHARGWMEELALPGGEVLDAGDWRLAANLC